MGNVKNPQPKTVRTEAELLELAMDRGFLGDKNGPRLNGREPMTVRQAGDLAALYGMKLHDVLAV